MVDFPKATSKEVDQVITTKLLIKIIKAGIFSSITNGEYQGNQIKQHLSKKSPEWMIQGQMTLYEGCVEYYHSFMKEL